MIKICNPRVVSNKQAKESFSDDSNGQWTELDFNDHGAAILVVSKMDDGECKNYAEQLMGMSEEIKSLKQELKKAQQDSEFLNYLELNPRHAQIMIDGKIEDCVFYGVSCKELTPIRTVIKTILESIPHGKESSTN